MAESVDILYFGAKQIQILLNYKGHWDPGFLHVMHYYFINFIEGLIPV